MIKILSLVILASALVLVSTTRVLAGNIYCPPNPGAVVVAHNVIVSGEVCTLAGTTVQGDVKVEAGGALVVTTGTRIHGDVKCNGCNSVGILAGRIKGDVKIKNATGGIIQSIGHDNTAGDIIIHGDVKYEDNSVRLFAKGADIGGDLKVSKNTNFPEAPIISGNTIDGDLKCEKNDLTPIIGLAMSPANVVAGDKKGQCAENLGF